MFGLYTCTANIEKALRQKTWCERFFQRVFVCTLSFWYAKTLIHQMNVFIMQTHVFRLSYFYCWKKIFKVKIHISKYMYKDIDLSTYEFLYSVRHSVFRLSDNRTGRTQSRFFNSLILLWLIYMLSYLLFFVVKLFSSFLRSKLSHMKKIRCSVHKTSFCFLKIVKSSDLQLRYLAINFFQCIFV